MTVIGSGVCTCSELGREFFTVGRRRREQVTFFGGLTLVKCSSLEKSVDLVTF